MLPASASRISCSVGAGLPSSSAVSVISTPGVRDAALHAAGVEDRLLQRVAACRRARPGPRRCGPPRRPRAPPGTGRRRPSGRRRSPCRRRSGPRSSRSWCRSARGPRAGPWTSGAQAVGLDGDRLAVDPELVASCGLPPRKRATTVRATSAGSTSSAVPARRVQPVARRQRARRRHGRRPRPRRGRARRRRARASAAGDPARPLLHRAHGDARRARPCRPRRGRRRRRRTRASTRRRRARSGARTRSDARAARAPGARRSARPAGRSPRTHGAEVDLARRAGPASVERGVGGEQRRAAGRPRGTGAREVAGERGDVAHGRERRPARGLGQRAERAVVGGELTDLGVRGQRTDPRNSVSVRSTARSASIRRSEM